MLEFVKKYRIELYWPNPETRDLDDLYVWFHEKKLKADLKMNEGDRFLFYEVANHPELKNIKGAKSLFASGTLTNERECIKEDEQVSGGKRWIFKRKVVTDFAVQPQKGVPLAEVKKLLDMKSWPQQGFEITKTHFNLLESKLMSRQEQLNAGLKPFQDPTAKANKPFAEKVIGRIVSSGRETDNSAKIANLEKSHNSHKLILNKLSDFLKSRGFKTSDNVQVDLFGSRSGKEWIFEVKSTHSGNMLGQIRHGVAQLYEYQYRYHRKAKNVHLCLVLQSGNCPVRS